jgi:flavin reductase (DIM6/NTAB) family NADH-FMN oxidoreductase RutF
MRVDFNPEKTGRRAVYALINAIVVPRLIAWVSTTSRNGVDNLAPHSYFKVASAWPPMLMFTSLVARTLSRTSRRIRRQSGDRAVFQAYPCDSDSFSRERL